MTARYRAREDNVIAFPGTMTCWTIRGGSYTWHCPIRCCHQSGRDVKKFRTALRGLQRHIDQQHPDLRRATA